ncbi:MAG: hypothetical protein AAF694_06875 [Bacteroidota bacterium]
MNNNVSLFFVTLACWTILFPNRGSGQEMGIEELAKKYSYTLATRDGRLVGPGAELLLYEATQTDFVCIGQDEGVAEIPQLIEAIYQHSHNIGLRFSHIALDVSDFSARQLESLAADVDASNLLQGYIKDHPGEISSFAWKEEIDMLIQLLETADYNEEILWGLGPVSPLGASSVLEYLIPLAPDNKSRKLVQKLLKQAQKGESTYRSSQDTSTTYLAQAGGSDFEALHASFDEIPEAIGIGALERSSQWYQKPTNERRLLLEEGLYNRFNRNYLRARNREAQAPRAMIKLPAEHLYRGKVPGTEIPAFGNRLERFIQQSKQQMLNIRIMAGPGSHVSQLTTSGQYQTVPNTSSDQEWMKPLSSLVKPEKWLVFNLRVMRKFIPQDLDPQLKKLINEYDILILMGSSSPGTPVG